MCQELKGVNSKLIVLLQGIEKLLHDMTMYVFRAQSLTFSACARGTVYYSYSGGMQTQAASSTF